MIKNVYFLTVHSPYEDPDAPGPINGLIVHALTFLHPDLPRPDAGRMYRCLTEFPGRTPGRLWPQVADWKPTVRALVELARTRDRCESMPLVIDPIEAALLTVGPFAPVPPGRGIPERHQVLDMFASKLPEATGEPPLWAGDNLIPPPDQPAIMPYLPHGS